MKANSLIVLTLLFMVIKSSANIINDMNNGQSIHLKQCLKLGEGLIEATERSTKAGDVDDFERALANFQSNSNDISDNIVYVEKDRSTFLCSLSGSRSKSEMLKSSFSGRAEITSICISRVQSYFEDHAANLSKDIVEKVTESLDSLRKSLRRTRKAIPDAVDNYCGNYTRGEATSAPMCWGFALANGQCWGFGF